MTAQLDGPHRSSSELWSMGTSLAIAVVSLVLAVGLMGCGSDPERAAAHLERAERLLVDGRRAEAVLEFRTALQRDPDNLEATRRLAQIELLGGEYESALDHLKAAYRLAPDSSEVTLELAKVLRAGNPKRARLLIDEVIAREPENVTAYMARSELELHQGRTEAALREARRALELAPDDPMAHLQYAYAVLGRIRHAQLLGRVSDPALQKAAISAFESYVEHGGSRPWNARIEQARVMSTLPGKRLEALALYRTAAEEMFAQVGTAEQLRGTRNALEFARMIGDDDLLDWSLGKLLGLRPQNIEAWVSLLKVRKRRSRSAEDVALEMVSQLPNDPQAHIEYARYIISRGRLAEALEYLEEKARDPNIEAPPLLGALANTLHAARRPRESVRMVERLELEYPGHPRAVLERAQLDLRAGKVQQAVESLRKLVKQFESRDAYRLLAHAEELSGNRTAAIRAVTSAIQSSPNFSFTEERIRARMLAENGRCPAAIKNLAAVRERTPLLDEDKILLALCRYNSGSEKLGRHLLEEVLAQPRPPPEAVLEYSRREGTSQGVTGRAYQELERLLIRKPQNWQAIVELTRLDQRAGRGEHALRRLDRESARNPDAVPARIRLLRARLRLAAGDPAAALDDAKAAVESEPHLPEAIELLASLYAGLGQPDAAIAALEQAGHLGALGARHHLLLGELHRAEGREELALHSFENALAAGSQRPILKNDVAFLLAKQGRDLERALRLATQAAAELANDPNAVDTLGYVYLQSGDAGVALVHFEDAIERTETPQPSFYYHLGLALRSLDRSEDAARAFEAALEINEVFPEAIDARQALEGTRGAGAS
jgi:tetratricopeptide (TPR) repeat protein